MLTVMCSTCGFECDALDADAAQRLHDVFDPAHEPQWYIDGDIDQPIREWKPWNAFEIMKGDAGESLHGGSRVPARPFRNAARRDGTSTTSAWTRWSPDSGRSTRGTTTRTRPRPTGSTPA